MILVSKLKKNSINFLPPSTIYKLLYKIFSSLNFLNLKIKFWILQIKATYTNICQYNFTVHYGGRKEIRKRNILNSIDEN